VRLVYGPGHRDYPDAQELIVDSDNYQDMDAKLVETLRTVRKLTQDLGYGRIFMHVSDFEDAGGGAGLILPEIGGQFLLNFLELVWDAENPTVRGFIDGCITSLGTSKETAVEIALSRLEYASRKKKFNNQHEDCTWQICRRAAFINFTREEEWEEQDKRFSANFARPPDYVPPHREFFLRTEREEKLYDRLNAGARIPAMLLLLCARSDYKNAPCQYFGDEMRISEARALDAEKRALTLVQKIEMPPMGHLVEQMNRSKC
jgi:hypothetical protein